MCDVMIACIEWAGEYAQFSEAPVHHPEAFERAFVRQPPQPHSTIRGINNNIISIVTVIMLFTDENDYFMYCLFELI